MSSPGRLTSAAAGDLQVVPVAERQTAALPPRPPSSSASTAVVEFKPSGLNPEDDEDLEVKLCRINECIPVRVSNTSGSSAGSGSGDFHQQAVISSSIRANQVLFMGEYRQMRRKEQDRLARMEADYERRKEIAEFNLKREERLKAAEERTAKKRSKRQKKKQRKKEKKSKLNTAGEEQQSAEFSDDDGGSDNDEVDG